MSYRTSLPVFDSERFRADVISYMDRWNLSGRSLFDGSEVGISAGEAFLRGEREPSLLLACALADVCDLSLDAYRKR